MSTKFVTKRPHKKSRAGCLTCKTRKIKCDEVRPACSFCTTRRIDCRYVSPPSSRSSSSASPESVISSPKIQDSSTLGDSEGDVEDVINSIDDLSLCQVMPSLQPLSTLADMRAMHHWSTYTYKTISCGQPGMDTVLGKRLPSLAFANPYLLNAVLGIASLQLQLTTADSSEARKQTAIYRQKAISGFRKALPLIDPKSDQYEAALLMAILLVPLLSHEYVADDEELTIVNWIMLYRGLTTVMLIRSFPAVMESSVAPIFRRYITELKTTPAIPTVLMNMVRSISPMDADYDHIESYCNTLDAVADLYAALEQDGVGTNLSIRIIAWPSYIKAEFGDLAKQKRPRALVILTYYLTFLKLIKDLWWTEGIPDKEIARIERLVGPQWYIFMEVPRRARFISDPYEIAYLLTGDGDKIPSPGVASSPEVEHEAIHYRKLNKTCQNC